MVKKVDYKVLVIYDIQDDKRRRLMNKTLLGFGVRIQKSAFECCIDAYEFIRLINKISVIINQTQDLMKVYRFTDCTFTKSYGQFEEPCNEEFHII